jgi:hypothetical protein
VGAAGTPGGSREREQDEATEGCVLQRGARAQSLSERQLAYVNSAVDAHQTAVNSQAVVRNSRWRGTSVYLEILVSGRRGRGDGIETRLHASDTL